MHGRWRRALRDRLRGSPERAGLEALLGMAEEGPVDRRVRALRQLGARREERGGELAWSALAAEAPGIRRAGAWLLGRLGEPSHGEGLLEALGKERQPEVALALALAAVHTGRPAAEAWSRLEGRIRCVVPTSRGPRDLSQALGDGLGEVRRRFELGTRAGAGERARQDALHALEADPSESEALALVAAAGHPGDLPVILGALAEPGRRIRHLAVDALGILGDPRALPELVSVLQATDVDPGYGFQQRRRAARSIGRLGLPEAGSALARAVEAEALDHEGRPGAGLGIQFPVRGALLLALGEAGARREADLLVRHLVNLHGSALGGFHLPAMAALVALGPLPELEAALAGEADGAANAVGVLAGWGQVGRARAYLADPRPLVAEAAREALRLAEPHAGAPEG